MDTPPSELAIKALTDLYYCSDGSLRRAAGSALAHLIKNNSTITLNQFLNDLEDPTYLNTINDLGKTGSANLKAYFPVKPERTYHDLE